MTRHLTSEQISECLISGARASAHANECASCGSEVAHLESALTEFRGAVRHWGEHAGQSRSVVGSQIISTEIPARGMYSGNEIKAGMSSLLVNAAIVFLLLIAGMAKPIQQTITKFIPLIAPDIRQLKPKAEVPKGGGASPQNSEATKGRLPKSAPRQFMPPVQPVDQPKLSLTPTILAPDAPNISSQNLGNPAGMLGLPSFGNGPGNGIGPGKGPGVGPGMNGDFGGEVYRPGGGITAPVAIVRPEPEYSDEARKAKWQGSVTLELIVDVSGAPKNIRVIRSLGMGLDEKAKEAVANWRFKPGMKDGKPVPVIATIEVTFRLL